MAKYRHSPSRNSVTDSTSPTEVSKQPSFSTKGSTSRTSPHSTCCGRLMAKRHCESTFALMRTSRSGLRPDSSSKARLGEPTPTGERGWLRCKPLPVPPRTWFAQLP